MFLTEKSKIPHLISLPALDAPLVAAAWWIIFAKSSGPVEWPVLQALFPAVWTVYLVDRIYDARTESGEGPPRKQFAAKHQKLLGALATISGVWALTASLQLSARVWVQAFALVTATGIYFLLFRGKRPGFSLPVKEIVIGLCFAAAMGIPYSWPVNAVRVGALLVFAVLCVVNCLLISRAEAKYDRETDPSSWFTQPNRNFPFTGILLVAGAATAALFFAGLHIVTTACLAVSALLLLCVSILKNEYPIQAAADAALLLPGIAGVLFLL